MSYQVKINGEERNIELLSREQDHIKVKVGDNVYDLDVLEVEPGVFSIISQGKNFNIQLLSSGIKKYKAETPEETLDIEIVDAESRYIKNQKGQEDEDADSISTPMPGQVVKILVKEGQEVKGGETVIIVSAMKMESEYKVSKDRVVKKVLVKEGDKIDGDQALILFE